MMSNSSKIWIGGVVFIVLTIVISAIIVRFSSGGDVPISFGFAVNTELRRTSELTIGADAKLEIAARSEDVIFYENDGSLLVIKEYYRSDSTKKLGDITQTDNKISFVASKVVNS